EEAFAPLLDPDESFKMRDLLPSMLRVSRAHGLRMPRDLVLVTKQLVYLDRYTRAIGGAKMHVLTDQRLTNLIMQDMLAAMFAARGRPSPPGAERGGANAHPACGHSPSAARVSAAMSIFCIVSIARVARAARAGSGSLMSSSSADGMICHERPKRSSSQPHAVGLPPPARSASQ